MLDMLYALTVLSDVLSVTKTLMSLALPMSKNPMSKIVWKEARVPLRKQRSIWYTTFRRRALYLALNVSSAFKTPFLKMNTLEGVICLEEFTTGKATSPFGPACSSWS